MMKTISDNELRALQESLRGGNTREVVIGGRRRRLFYNSERALYGMYNYRSRTQGAIFNSWEKIESIVPVKGYDNAAVVSKYKKLALRAGFTNRFIQQCLSAMPNKSPYENGLTTGAANEGEVVTLKRVEKACPPAAQEFREAVRQRRPYQSHRFPMGGYEASLSVWNPCPENPNWIEACLNMEYKNCANGRYYLMINEETFIGYDID